MSDIVDERYEFELEEDEIFDLELQMGEDGVDWMIMGELLAIDHNDTPPAPAYPMVVVIKGKPT